MKLVLGRNFDVLMDQAAQGLNMILNSGCCSGSSLARSLIAAPADLATVLFHAARWGSTAPARWFAPLSTSIRAAPTSPTIQGRSGAIWACAAGQCQHRHLHLISPQGENHGQDCRIRTGSADLPARLVHDRDAEEVADKPVPLRFFGREFVAYRGESGKVYLVDAYCPHMRSTSPATPPATSSRTANRFRANRSAAPVMAGVSAPTASATTSPIPPTASPRRPASRPFR
jgi:hypothetical protein